MMCTYILLLADGVSEHFNNQKLFQIFFSSFSSRIHLHTYLHTVLESLRAVQQDFETLKLSHRAPHFELLSFTCTTSGQAANLTFCLVVSSLSLVTIVGLSGSLKDISRDAVTFL